MRRAVQRAKLDRKTNIELVETMWEQFCGLGRYEAHVIDATNCSVQETVFRHTRKNRKRDGCAFLKRVCLAIQDLRGVINR